MSDVYRQAASILVVRPAHSGGYELLLLHKPRKRDAWQLPQGGVEQGETAEQAALRELGEEAGITTATILGTSDAVYQYDFPPAYRRFRPDNIRGQRIVFLLASVPAGTEVTVDGKEIDASEWMPLAKVKGYVRRPEYVGLVQRLYDETLALLPR